MSFLYTDAHTFWSKISAIRTNRRAIRARAWLLAPLGMAAALALTACHRETPPVTPPAVVVALPVHPAGTDAAESLHYPVEAAARYANPMSFRVAGKILARDVRLGDVVRKGQPVARLDPADAEKHAAAARAALDAAEHRLMFAKQTLDRDTAQFAQRLIAESALEQTQDAYSGALAAREQAADQWEVARNSLHYHSLVADHDGVITGESADTGQFVAAGQAVYGLAWTGDLDVDLDAAASDLARIAIGQSATVTFPALAGRRFGARVREIAPAADPQSRTYRVKLGLTAGNPAVRLGMTGDAVLEPVSPGSSARGTPAAAAVPTFKIPSSAVFHQGDRPAVWVIRAGDSTLELRPVTVRSYTDGSVILSGGLADGDQVVMAGVHTVFAGEHVSAVKPLFADGNGNE